MPKRTKDERERDLAEVAKHYLRGMVQIEIVKKLCEGKPYTLSLNTLRNDLKELRRRWIESSMIDFNEARSNELAKLDHLENTYWDAWEESRRHRETSMHAQEQGRDAKLKTSLRREQQVGDPRFLDGVMRCGVERRKILGLYQQETSEGGSQTLVQIVQLAREKRDADNSKRLARGGGGDDIDVSTGPGVVHRNGDGE
jgi:hypothetical protein